MTISQFTTQLVVTCFVLLLLLGLFFFVVGGVTDNSHQKALENAGFVDYTTCNLVRRPPVQTQWGDVSAGYDCEEQTPDQ